MTCLKVACNYREAASSEVEGENSVYQGKEAEVEKEGGGEPEKKKKRVGFHDKRVSNGFNLKTFFD